MNDLNSRALKVKRRVFTDDEGQVLPSGLGRSEKMVMVEQAIESLLETSFISGEFRPIEGIIHAKHRGL